MLNRRIIWIGFCTLLVALAPRQQDAEAKSYIAYISDSTNSSVIYWIAKEAGLFKKHGLDLMPLSAFVSTPKIWSVLEKNPFIHTSTFGGNPLACAAGIAAIHVTLEEDLVGQAYKKGRYLLGELMALQMRYDRVLRKAQGKGLLLGLEFENTEIGYKVVANLFKRGVLVAGTLTNSRVVRIEPALNISDELIDEVLEILEETLKEVDRETAYIHHDEDDE